MWGSYVRVHLTCPEVFLKHCINMRLVCKDYMTCVRFTMHWATHVCRDVKLEGTYFDRSIEQAFLGASRSLFETKTRPSTHLAVQVGNMYTPSLYGGLASFITEWDRFDWTTLRGGESGQGGVKEKKGGGGSKEFEGWEVQGEFIWDRIKIYILDSPEQ